MRFFFITLTTILLSSPALAAAYDAPLAAEVYCSLRKRGVPQRDAFRESLNASMIPNTESGDPVVYNGKLYPRALFEIYNAIHSHCPYYAPQP